MARISDYIVWAVAKAIDPTGFGESPYFLLKQWSHRKRRARLREEALASARRAIKAYKKATKA